MKDFVDLEKEWNLSNKDEKRMYMKIERKSEIKDGTRNVLFSVEYRFIKIYIGMIIKSKINLSKIDPFKSLPKISASEITTKRIDVAVLSPTSFRLKLIPKPD